MIASKLLIVGGKEGGDVSLRGNGPVSAIYDDVLPAGLAPF